MVKADKERMAALHGPLLTWYQENARDLPWRIHPDPYRVWISEIMLQQTRVEAGRDYFLRWMEALPDIEALANVSDDRLMKLWEGLGYYNRARNLKKAAGIIMEQYGGKIPATYEGLLSLPGIGPYTAGAIGSIAFGLPFPAVDGNVLRVTARLLASGDDITAPGTKKWIEELLIEILPGSRPGDFNQALMELGALICIPNGEPRCSLCPVSELCLARQEGRTDQLPVKGKKKKRKIEKKTVLILRQEQRILLHKRGEKGLLAGLWELPNCEGYLTKKAAGEWLLELLRETFPQRAGLPRADVAPQVSLRVSAELLALPQVKHIFSHVEWHMKGYEVELAPSAPAFGMSGERENAGEALLVAENPHAYSRATLKEVARYVWVNERDLTEGYSLPSAFQPYRQFFFSAK